MIGRPTKLSVPFRRWQASLPMRLSRGAADHAYIYTTDSLAGEEAEAVLASEGYGDSVTYVNGFRFVEDLLE